MKGLWALQERNWEGHGALFISSRSSFGPRYLWVSALAKSRGVTCAMSCQHLDQILRAFQQDIVYKMPFDASCTRASETSPCGLSATFWLMLWPRSLSAQHA